VSVVKGATATEVRLQRAAITEVSLLQRVAGTEVSLQREAATEMALQRGAVTVHSSFPLFSFTFLVLSSKSSNSKYRIMIL
jgi:hypothetical protein